MLVLLAPFGGVGITTTPVETEIVASPRSPSASLVQVRLDGERQATLAAPPLVTVRTETECSVAPPPSLRVIAVERCAATGSRAPPV